MHLTNCCSVGVFPWDDQFFMKLSIEGSLLYQLYQFYLIYLNLRYANCVVRHARCHELRGRVIQVTNNFNCNISGSLYTSTFLGLSPLGRVDWGCFQNQTTFSWALTWNTAPMQSMQSKKLRNEQVYVWRQCWTGSNQSGNLANVHYIRILNCHWNWKNI